MLKKMLITILGGLLLSLHPHVGALSPLKKVLPGGPAAVSLLTPRPSGAAVADAAHYLDSIKGQLRRVWPENRTINLVFHGHSVVAGYQDLHEVHTFESYPYQLLRQLKQKYPYAVINIIVTAIGGENAEQGAKRFKDEVLIHRPDVLFIDYALNDIGMGLKRSEAAWRKMIEQALQQHIKVILVTPSPDKRIDLLAPENKLALHAEQIRKLAAEYHIGLADPFSRFQHLAQKEGSINKYMSHVNHPNKWGNAIIANELIKWF